MGCNVQVNSSSKRFYTDDYHDFGRGDWYDCDSLHARDLW
jgi:hypothetical protein